VLRWSQLYCATGWHLLATCRGIWVAAKPWSVFQAVANVCHWHLGQYPALTRRSSTYCKYTYCLGQPCYTRALHASDAWCCVHCRLDRPNQNRSGYLTLDGIHSTEEFDGSGVHSECLEVVRLYGTNAVLALVHESAGSRLLLSNTLTTVFLRLQSMCWTLGCGHRTLISKAVWVIALLWLESQC
jgi:hypothetical protein